MSKICYIVGACKESFKDFKYDENDLIIASDGGLKFLENKYRVDIVVGDFDSLNYIPREYNPIILPRIKDITDTHKCIEIAIEKGYEEIVILGCVGGRFEHTIATIQDAYNYTLKGCHFTIYSAEQTFKIIHNESLNIKQKEGFISVFSLSDISENVSIKNLKYEVSNITLTNQFPLGVSNEFVDKEAIIEVKNGTLLIVY